MLWVKFKSWIPKKVKNNFYHKFPNHSIEYNYYQKAIAFTIKIIGARAVILWLCKVMLGVNF